MGKWPLLDKIEMIDGPIDEKTYDRDLEKLQHHLLDLQTYHLRSGGRVVIGIDGWDAAGKGGLIERIVAGLEPKFTQVWRIGAPTPEEQGRTISGDLGPPAGAAIGRPSIAPGTAACWSSASRAGAASRPSGPIARSTSSNATHDDGVRASSRSSSMSAQRSRSGG
jgi:hypothetical protein